MSEESHKKTEFYARFSPKRTQAHGWEPETLTISTTYEEGKEPTPDQMVAVALRCHTDAWAACDAMNAQEAERTRFTR